MLTQLLLATSATPPSECQGPEAAELAQLTFMSRQNYARWHSYELHISTAAAAHVRLCLPSHVHEPLHHVLRCCLQALCVPGCRSCCAYSASTADALLPCSRCSPYALCRQQGLHALC